MMRVHWDVLECTWIMGVHMAYTVVRTNSHSKIWPKKKGVTSEEE